MACVALHNFTRQSAMDDLFDLRDQDKNYNPNKELQLKQLR
jgi:hypothetical protein